MKDSIDPSKLYWASFNRFELRISDQAVLDCSHPGPCDADVERHVDAVREQIEKDNLALRPTPAKIRAELAEYGAWDDKELADDEQNFRRLVWLVAGNIAEDEPLA